MERVAIFAFKEDPMCFAHAMLNAQDMYERGYEVKLVIEGSATRQVFELTDRKNPFAPLYEKLKAEGVIDCVCKACANKTNTIKSAENQGLRLCDEMSGHPSIARYYEDDYEVLIF